MDNHRLIQPSHLNHYGYLFGGNMLKWSDEYAYIAACADFPQQRFVTIAMNDLVFKKGVRSGDVLLFRALLARRGKTSVHYDVSVYRTTCAASEDPAGEKIFATRVSYVCVDENGNKKQLPA